MDVTAIKNAILAKRKKDSETKIVKVSSKKSEDDDNDLPKTELKTAKVSSQIPKKADLKKPFIAAAGSVESSAVRDAIENTKDLQVTHFKWTVDKDTHNPMNKPASIFQAKGNKLVFLEKWEPMAN